MDRKCQSIEKSGFHQKIEWGEKAHLVVFGKE